MEEWYKFTVKQQGKTNKGHFIKKDTFTNGVVQAGMEILTGFGLIRVVEVFEEPCQEYGKFVAEKTVNIQVN